jgi:hypothetical protein
MTIGCAPNATTIKKSPNNCLCMYFTEIAFSLCILVSQCEIDWQALKERLRSAKILQKRWKISAKPLTML